MNTIANTVRILQYTDTHTKKAEILGGFSNKDKAGFAAISHAKWLSAKAGNRPLCVWATEDELVSYLPNGEPIGFYDILKVRVR